VRECVEIKGLKLINGGGSRRCEICALPKVEEGILYGPQNLPVGEKYVKLDVFGNVGQANTLDKCTYSTQSEPTSEWAFARK
jgi:hypothetical protein